MNPVDSQFEFVKLWREWSRRTAFLDKKHAANGAVLLYCELVIKKNPLVMRGPLSGEDQLPTIKKWIEDAENQTPCP